MNTEYRTIKDPPKQGKIPLETIRAIVAEIKREPLPIRTVTTLRKRKNKLHHSR